MRTQPKYSIRSAKHIWTEEEQELDTLGGWLAQQRSYYRSLNSISQFALMKGYVEIKYFEYK